VQERPRSAEEQVLKVRITDLGRGGDSFTADVAGSKRVFRVERASLLRSFRTGDLVIASTNAAGLVVDLRAASISGRVVSADRRVGRLVVEVDGREQSYAVDDRDLLDDVQAGDRIRFEVEERGAGRPVVTAIF
jgi:Cu/Ag efflux protein CusF